MRGRQELLARLGEKPRNLLIIGGGIIGAGIARDAAMRGLSVALIEQGDFAGGTSSKTSKLIHGGLRYLEHGQWRLVAESLRERSTLRAIAPECVHPLTLLLPVYEGDPRALWKIRAGLWLYDVLAWRHNVRTHRMLSARRAQTIEPRLRGEGLRGAGLYGDCRMDDARLCLANILQAMQLGATCANYVRLRSFLTMSGHVCGAVAEDVFTGSQFEIHAQAVVNATGPWSDAIRRMSDPRAEPRLAPTKGIHLILPRVAQQALFVQARRRGRMIFVVPWGDDYSLVGTTESDVTGSLETLRADADEVGYLLDEINRVMPGCAQASDVIATFAGARPLLAFSGSPTSASREHRVEIDRSGVVSVLGGKYTTYRLIAQQVVDGLVRRHQWVTDRCLTDQVRLFETIHPVALARWQEVTRTIDPDLLARLFTRYGAGVFRALELLEQEPGLIRPVCPHHEDLEVELAYALRHELAWTITDVMARRTRLAWSACQGLDALSTLAGFFRRYAGLSTEAIEGQISDYHRFLKQGLAFRSADAALVHQ